MIRPWLLAGAALLLSAAAPSKPSNGPADGPANVVDIHAGTVTGTALINVAAGNSNQQANAGVLAASQGHGSTLITLDQESADAADSAGRVTTAIAADSFAGSAGWLAINGAAGSGNQQANIAAIAIGTTGAALSDTALSQARASHGPTAGPDEEGDGHDRSVAIGNGAFANSTGLVQVSLIGGDRNSSANTFALSSAGGTIP